MISFIYTIGGYGFKAEQYFCALQEENIDLLCDVRQRRGVRGATYAFLNSKQVQSTLASKAIEYIHLRGLAPTSDIREQQHIADKASGTKKRDRTFLGEAFRHAYIRDVLDSFTDDEFIGLFPSSIHRPCFFCVEQLPSACHRKIVAERMSQILKVPVVHLVPPL